MDHQYRRETVFADPSDGVALDHRAGVHYLRAGNARGGYDGESTA